MGDRAGPMEELTLPSRKIQVAEALWYGAGQGGSLGVGRGTGEDSPGLTTPRKRTFKIPETCKCSVLRMGTIPIVLSSPVSPWSWAEGRKEKVIEELEKGEVRWGEERNSTEKQPGLQVVGVCDLTKPGRDA